MALVLNDRVLESSTSTGTGTFTLNGAAAGFQTFSAGVGGSNTTYYTIVNTGSVSSEWEVGLGTLDAGGTVLTRTTVYKSSNANAAVVFTAGTKNVFVTYPSSKSVNYAADSSLTLTGATITNTGSMTFSGTALRFTGDFSNATVTNRLTFGTSTVDSTTGIYALPNGTGTGASWQAANNSDPTNCSKILIAANGATDVQLVSGVNGSGTYLPLTFQNDGSEKARLSVAGGFSVGTTTDPGAGVILANNGVKVGTSAATQVYPYVLSTATVGIGAITTYVAPLQSYTYSFADANATTANYININASGKSTAALIAVGVGTGGSGYTSGTYTNVPLTGGSGTGAVAATIVVSVGAVTSITLSSSGTGSGYAYGDTLSASAANLGGAGSGFSVPVALIAVGGDELEMDGIKVSAQCLTNGTVTVYVDASPGYIAGGRTFAYSLG